MEKITRIEEFLKLMANIAKSGQPIDDNLVYANLIYKDSRKSIKDNFNYWIERYRNNKNIRVFVNPNWSYFCQFISKKGQENGYEKLKLYFPLDSRDIYEGANLIFDFLSNNNIEHLSKIGSHCRIDDIVVRLNSKEDAEKLINFVRNNSFLKEKILDPNPFTFHNQKISMAWDGDLSYNSTISKIIADYINSLIKSNSLNTVSYSSFVNFVASQYKHVFEDGSEIINFAKSRNIKGTPDDIANSLVNYQDITRLFLKSLNPQAQIDSLYSEWELSANEAHQIESINKMMSLYYQAQSNNKKPNKTAVELNENITRILDYAFSISLEKYGYDTTTNNFEIFSFDGDYARFTRTGQVREMIIKNNISREMVATYLTDKKIALLDAATMATYKKYGYDHVKGAVSKATNYHTYESFTNSTEKFREKLQREINPKNIKSIIIRSLEKDGYDIANYNNDLIEAYTCRIIDKYNQERKRAI